MARPRRSPAVGVALFVLLGAPVAGGCSSSEAPPTPGVQTGTDPFCSTRPKLQFCEDFDTLELPGAFSELDEGGGSLTLIDDTSASEPRSLRVESNGQGAALLRRAFTAGSKFRLFMLVQLTAPPVPNGDADARAELGALEFPTEGGMYRLGVALAGDGHWFVFESTTGGIRKLPVTAPLTTGDWTSVRFDVDFVKGGESTVFVRFGDESVVPHTAITPPFDTAAPSVALGLAASGMPPMKVGIDNVTFQVD